MTDPSRYNVSTQLLALCSLGNVPPRLLETLFRVFGPPESILKTKASELKRINGITDEMVQHITAATKLLEKAESLSTNLADRDIEIISRFDKDYPSSLFELNDPPPLLFVRGRLIRQDMRSVCLVGAAEPTNEGIKMTTRIAREFASKDVQIISSLAGGIDMAAHLGAKAAQRASFAVLDGGFDSLDFEEAMPVAIDIVQTGGIISEYLPNRKPDRMTMAESNRMLVGLAQAVVVTELYNHSISTLDLLDFCNEIGKLTFFMVDPEIGALADEQSLSHAAGNGAIMIEGQERVHDIIRALV